MTATEAAPLLGQGGSSQQDLLWSLPTSCKENPRALKIAIVGAGVAGLVTARVLKSRGYQNLTLLEASSQVGGVWALGGYHNYGVQTPGSLYEFPDKELPEPKNFKDGEAVLAYCAEYAKEHELNKILQLNTCVTKIEQEKGHGWTLSVASTTDGSTKDLVFDFVILATGLYSGEHKFIPSIEGLQEHFQGKIYHSQETSNIQGDRKGKQAVVVGFGKSAHDCAMSAFEQTGVPPVLLFRASHWCVPRKVLGLIPMEWLIYSRFGQGTLPRWEECGPIEWVFHTLGWPLIWLYWRIVEILFSLQLGWYGKFACLRPKLAIEDDMYCGHGVICHPDVFPMMRRGEIKPIKGAIEKVLPSGKLLLQDGTEIQADEIVFATGYHRQLDFLPQELKDCHEADGIWAYRHMIVPGVPNIAFLNSNVSTFSNITTPGLQAAWLADLVEGKMELTEDVKASVDADKQWRREHLQHAKGDYRAIFIQLHQIRYWDRLLRDMGINVKRKTTGGFFFAALKTFFEPIASADYKDIVTGDYKNHKQQLRPRNYTPSYWLEWSVLGLIVAALSVGW